MADNYIERQYEAYQARKAAWEKERKYEKKKPTAPAETPHRSGAFLQNQVKKVVAVHDLSGVGHVSLMAVIPVLSSMGFQVCPLPTAVLSAHTQYPTYSFLDLTDEMKRIIENWEKMNVHFDTFYTGYLGSPQQAQIVEEFILKFRGENDMVVVDPVLGDNGHLYKGITEEMVTEMKKLIHLADVITPNLTELYYVALSAQTAAAPGYFFPDEKSQLVAEPQNDAGLLIVPQADKVGTHLFYLLHFGAHHLFGQGSAYSGMVFMAVSAAQQQPLAVQVERPFLFEAEMAEAEVLGGAQGISVVDKFCHAGVESWRVGAPQLRAFQGDLVRGYFRKLG